jgi:CheY-like chemotaxis protein
LQKRPDDVIEIKSTRDPGMRRRAKDNKIGAKLRGEILKMAVKILIVEDETVNMELLDALLNPEGYLIVKAGSGEAALEYLSGNEPDLVLLDIVMPGISGFSVLKAIRESGKNRTVPVILLSSLSDREDRLKGLAAGADDYISRPFDGAELIFKVQTQAELSVLRRQINEINEKEKLAEVMDLVDEGAILTDCLFNIKQMNRTAMDMFGMKAQFGNLEDIMLKKYDCIIDRETKKGKLFMGRPETASGRPFYLSAEYRKTGLPENGQCSYVFVFKDVSDDYSESRIKMGFLKLISDKFQVPLTVISGYSTALNSFESDDMLKDIIASIVQNSGVMQDLMKRVLFFVKIENTSLTKTTVLFDAGEAVKKCMLEHKKSCDFTGPLEPVRIPYWQELAARELIDNAIKFNDGKNPALKVRFEPDGMIVEDNGPGIPDEDLKKVFEPFYQVNKNLPASRTGVGIGLSIAKTLAESALCGVTLENCDQGGIRAVISGKIA